MRADVDNGNGSMCDKCGKYMLPKQAYKLKIFKLDPNPERASTGMYIRTDGCDLCKNCREDIMKIATKWLVSGHR